MNKKLTFVALFLIAYNSFGDAIRFDYCKDYQYYNVQNTATAKLRLSLVKITCISNGVEKNIPLVTEPYDTVYIPAPLGTQNVSIGILERPTWIIPDSLSDKQKDPRSIHYAIYAVGISKPYFTRQK